MASAFRRRTQTNPRTVLAFVGTVLVAVTFAGIFAIGLLAGTEELQWLVPLILISLLVLVVVTVGAVLGIAWKDPAKLMLGQVTGTEYAEIRRVQLGDSVTGVHEAVRAIPSGTLDLTTEDVSEKAIDVDATTEESS